MNGSSISTRGRKLGLGLYCSAAIVALTSGSIASAQTPTSAAPVTNAPSTEPASGSATPAADAAGPLGGSDIVVTARRSSEKLKDVPVAVTAFGTQQLAEQRITTEVDLQRATPGLTVRAAVSSNQINYAIRGQSVDGFSFSAPAVATYFNEVPTNGTSSTSLFDLESVQVLKGPQGTLFGRNSTGGAVLYQAKTPDNDFGGYLKGAYGNFNDREIEGALNVPITEGVIVRLSGRSQTRDGYQHNLLDGSRINSVDSQVGRASLLIAPPGSGFRNLTVFQRGHYGGTNGGLNMQIAYGVNGAPSTYIDPATGAVTPLVTSLATFHGPDATGPGTSSTDPRVNALFNGIGDYLAKRASGAYGGFYDTYLNRDQRHKADQTFLSNTTTYDLGSLTLKNIFGYNKVFSEDNLDVDGSPYEFFGALGGPPQHIDGGTYSGNGYVFGNDQWSDELQISGKAGRLKYIAGGFISQEKIYSFIPVTILPDLGSPYLGGYSSKTTDKSKALYAQVSYALTDRLNLSGGIRYTWENVRIVFPTSTPGDPKLLSGIIPTRSKEAKPSWLAGIDYKVTDSLLLYFNQRGSWRTGGFNGTSGAKFPNADFFKPETTHDFEFGAKFSGRVAGVPASLNLALYEQFIKNVQRTIYINNAAEAGNANKARVRGAELNGTIRPALWLELGGAFAYTDAVYTDNHALVGGQTFFFDPYADAPKWTGSAYFRASSKMLGDAGELALRGDIYAQSHFFYSNLNDTLLPFSKIGGYHLLNARLEWNGILGSQVNAAAFVNNLTKTKYSVGGIALGAVTGSNATIPGEPRMYGVEVAVKF